MWIRDALIQSSSASVPFPISIESGNSLPSLGRRGEWDKSWWQPGSPCCPSVQFTYCLNMLALLLRRGVCVCVRAFQDIDEHAYPPPARWPSLKAIPGRTNRKGSQRRVCSDRSSPSPAGTDCGLHLLCVRFHDSHLERTLWDYGSGTN